MVISMRNTCQSLTARSLYLHTFAFLDSTTLFSPRCTPKVGTCEDKDYELLTRVTDVTHGSILISVSPNNKEQGQRYYSLRLLLDYVVSSSCEDSLAFDR